MGNSSPAPTTPPCCPPGSLPSASAQQAGATEPTLGEVIHLPNHKTDEAIATYSVFPPNGKPIIGAIIICHDIFGFDSGRTHHVADYFASQGYFVVSPDWFGPSLSAPIYNMKDLIWPPWRLFTVIGRVRHPWKDIEQKLVDVILPYVHAKAQKVCMLGFCYGGWIAARAAGLPGNLFLGAASPHPSFQIQNRQAEGPTLEEMLRAVTCPFFLAPAGNDTKDAGEDGEWIRLMRENPKAKDSFAVLYPNQTHGWAVRGDIRDPKIKVDVDDVFARTLVFFNKCVGV